MLTYKAHPEALNIVLDLLLNVCQQTGGTLYCCQKNTYIKRTKFIIITPQDKLQLVLMFRLLSKITSYQQAEHWPQVSSKLPAFHSGIDFYPPCDPQMWERDVQYLEPYSAVSQLSYCQTLEEGPAHLLGCHHAEVV